MHVTTFLPADFLPILINSISALVVAGRGVGNVVRSFVLLTSILKRDKRIHMQRKRIQQPVVNRKKTSNSKITAQAHIIATVRNGGND